MTGRTSYPSTPNRAALFMPILRSSLGRAGAGARRGSALDRVRRCDRGGSDAAAARVAVGCASRTRAGADLGQQRLAQANQLDTSALVNQPGLAQQGRGRHGRASGQVACQLLPTFAERPRGALSRRVPPTPVRARRARGSPDRAAGRLGCRRWAGCLSSGMPPACARGITIGETEANGPGHDEHEILLTRGRSPRLPVPRPRAAHPACRSPLPACRHPGCGALG